MGLLDDTLKQLTQGGNANQPLLAVFQELLVGKQQDGAQAGQPQQQAEMPRANVAQQGQTGGSAGPAAGLGGLLAQLQAAGLDDVVRSWISAGENKPVQPKDLGDALGKKTVDQMADKAGCESNDLLSQLSKALPGIIDKLTHDGRIPSQQEISQRLKG
ncbi:MAG: YidB family protein [Hyphomicrobium sp.]|jgi:uncharacterized protein YidB (DUF937 family)